MATILELARHADVSAESVLRVLHREPVSEDVASRVSEALAALGPPAAPAPTPSVDVLPAARKGLENGQALERRHEELLERFAAAKAELEVSLPEGVGSVVEEALRAEVRPVAQSVAELSALLDQMIRRLDSMGGAVEGERHERIEDVALLIELITTGWRTVDRRLGRLEQMIARIETRPESRPPGRVIRFKERSSPSGD